MEIEIYELEKNVNYKNYIAKSWLFLVSMTDVKIENTNNPYQE